MELEVRSDFIEELKFWVAKAKEADPEYKIFGSKKHKYTFNDPISLNEVREFEKEHEIKLPENYVRVLTEIGNGGAGPYYGLYPLKEIINYQSGSLFTKIGSEETLIDDTLTPEKWCKMIEKLETLEDDEEYDELFQKLFSNSVVVGTQGCTFDSLLMCAGSEYNRIINIDWNLDKDRLPHFSHMTFEEWILEFFKEVAAGHDLHNYGYVRLGTEAELMKDYDETEALDQINEDKRYKKLRGIISSLHRFSKLSTDTVKRLTKNPNKELISPLIDLLKKTDQEIAISLFEKEFYGDTPETVISVCCRLPEEGINKYYERALEILYSPELFLRILPYKTFKNRNEPCAENLLFFINKCKNKQAADIVKYASDKENPIECRKTAIYVMSCCPDITDYEDKMADWMCDEDYWIAHTAIQGTNRAGLKSERIIKIVKWLKEEKYKDDSLMQSNLNSLH